MTGWHVTRMRPVHADGLARCHIESWRESYRGLVAQHILDAFDVEQRAADFRRLVAEHPIVGALADTADRPDAEVVGFAEAAAATEPDAPAPLELRALYVRQAYQGAGVADALLDAAVPPQDPCMLWVFEANPRAQAFYRRHGFRLDGAREPDLLSGGVITVRMVRR
jgi:ribosomal protein S18 acetylase RimI-like enzyme